ncbi:MAG: nucleoside phosphorylase [archaeon]
MQPHLKIDKVEKYVILPGDPGRINKILTYLGNPEEVQFNREYRTSKAEHLGIKISCVSSGIGCPSAAIAVEELAKIGAKVIIRLGTCGGLLKEMQPGDLMIPEAAFCGDGTSKEYGKESQIIKANEKVFSALKKAAESLKVRHHTGVNRTHDAFYEPIENFIALEGKNLASSEMECSSVYLVSKIRNLMAGAVLVINTPEPPELVKENPSIIYQLIDKEKVNQGMENAIKVILEAIKILEQDEQS